MCGIGGEGWKREREDMGISSLTSWDPLHRSNEAREEIEFRLRCFLRVLKEDGKFSVRALIFVHLQDSAPVVLDILGIQFEGRDLSF